MQIDVTQRAKLPEVPCATAGAGPPDRWGLSAMPPLPAGYGFLDVNATLVPLDELPFRLDDGRSPPRRRIGRNTGMPKRGFLSHGPAAVSYCGTI